jgi:hypothetical protein
VRLVNVAEKVVGTKDAEVTRLVDEPAAFSMDVRVPEGSRHVGGAPEVGDITAGGLRLDYNRKRNLSPGVQPYLYRLVCTNGYVCFDPGLKLDARGDSVDEVLAELEAMAELAFSQVEEQIKHFYDLREVPVENPERAIRVLATEQNIPERSTSVLMDAARSGLLPDQPSQFDVVNLVTNFANSPRIRNDGGRLILERAGGAVVAERVARCGHCQQRTVTL